MHVVKRTINKEDKPAIVTKLHITRKLLPIGFVPIQTFIYK